MEQLSVWLGAGLVTAGVSAALLAGFATRYGLDAALPQKFALSGHSLGANLVSGAAGLPQPQNPPAVDELSAAWFNDWFAGDTSVGDSLVPGTTIDVPTPQGTAHGVVIGSPQAATLPPGAVTIAPKLATIRRAA